MSTLTVCEGFHGLFLPCCSVAPSEGLGLKIPFC
jgi:hypothetical protein